MRRPRGHLRRARASALAAAALLVVAVVLPSGALSAGRTVRAPQIDADAGTGWMEVPDPWPWERPSPIATPLGAKTVADVPYVQGAHLGCPGPGVDEACSGSQTLDVYETAALGRRPVILWIHGGGWISGDKDNVVVPLGDLRAQGFDIVAVNYRLSYGPSAVPFPGPVQDVKAAVRWVKANADRYLFDPGAILAMGTSAGGHLAQMLATSADVPGLEPVAGLTPAQAAADSRVAGAISFSAMGDLPTFLADRHPWAEVLTAWFLGCAWDCPPELLRQASSTGHVTADDAPVYAATGALDLLALPHVTDVLGQRYAAAGVGGQLYDDAVDTGPTECQGHDPWCGVNSTSFNAFVNHFRVLAAQHRAHPFVTAVYRDLLRRDPSSAELAAWAAKVDDAAGRRAFAWSVARSEGHLGLVVDQLCRRILDRDPDAGGRRYWIDALGSGRATPAAVAACLHASAEHFAAVGSDLGRWVDDLYDEVLGRTPDPAGRDFWIQIARRDGRDRAASAVLQSWEARMRRVAEAYVALLGRRPDAAGQAYWAEVLLQTGDDIALAIALVASDEYFLRTQR